ncbi:MAG: zf-HC2 domain-containing protein [Anaerolineales bacterium]
MNFLKPSPLEQLSAYLDGKLTPRQRADLETQLAANPQLRADLEALRRTRTVLRAAPRLRAPRNFTLTPQMVRARPQLPTFYPYLRWSTALTGILVFFILLGNHLVLPLTTARNAAPMLTESAPMLLESPADAAAPLRLPTDETPPADLLPVPEGMGAGGGGGTAPDEFTSPEMLTATIAITASEPISQPFAVAALPPEDTAPSAKIAGDQNLPQPIPETFPTEQNTQDWRILEIALVLLAVFQAILLWYYRWRSGAH